MDLGKTPLEYFYGNEKKKVQKIKESSVREIFTPHTPVADHDQLIGRRETIKTIIRHINTPGVHCILFGDRGVGKTSVANIIEYLIEEGDNKSDVYKISCEANTTLQNIFQEPLSNIDYDISITSTSKNKARSKNINFSVKVAGAGLKKNDAKTEIKKGNYEFTTIDDIVKLLSSSNGVLILDEADNISNESLKEQITQFIKISSDKNSNFKVLLVGIAETGEKLKSKHISTERCLYELKLDKLDDFKLKQIIKKGAKELGIKFDQEVINRIVNLSNGFPHFTHLIALHCAVFVILKDKYKVGIDDLRKAINIARDENFGSIERNYKIIVRRFRSEKYKLVLIAASLIKNNYFELSDVKKYYDEISKKELTKNSISYYLGKIINTEKIITRIRRGLFKFTDPRMKSYILFNNFNFIYKNYYSKELKNKIDYFTQIHSEIKKIGVSQKERNKLEDILDELSLLKQQDNKSNSIEVNRNTNMETLITKFENWLEYNEKILKNHKNSIRSFFYGIKS